MEQATFVTIKARSYLALASLQHMNLYLYEIQGGEDKTITPMKIIEKITAFNIHKRSSDLMAVFINDMIWDSRDEAFITASSDYAVNKLSLQFRI